MNLWAKHSFTTKSEIPLGISLTEFYDVLEIQNFMTKNFSASLQKEVKILENRLKATEENAELGMAQMESLQRENDDLDESIVFAEEAIGRLRNEVRILKDKLSEKQTTTRRRSIDL